MPTWVHNSDGSLFSDSDFREGNQHLLFPNPNPEARPVDAKTRERVNQVHALASQGTAKTVGRLDLRGKTYYGNENWAPTDKEAGMEFKKAGYLNPETGATRPPKLTGNHAEGHVFYQELIDNQNQKGSGGTADLYLNRAPCAQCGDGGGIRALGKSLKVDQVNVYWRIDDNLTGMRVIDCR